MRAFKEGLLEAASKVSGNKWGDREWAANRGACVEETFNVHVVQWSRVGWSGA